MGLLISREHLNKAMVFIEKGKSEGARLFTEGDHRGSPSESQFANGNFPHANNFTNCHDEMSIVREEILAPKVPLFYHLKMKVGR